MALKAGSGGLNKKYVDVYGNLITSNTKKGGKTNAIKSRKKRSK